MGLNWDWGGFLKGVAGPVSKYLDPSETALREFNQAQIAKLEQETAQLRRQNEFWQMILEDEQQPPEVRQEAAKELLSASRNLSHLQQGLREPLPFHPTTGKELIDQWQDSPDRQLRESSDEQRRFQRPVGVAPRDGLTPRGHLPSRPIPPRGTPPTGLQRPLQTRPIPQQARPELTRPFRYPFQMTDKPRVQQASFRSPPGTPPPTPAPTELQAQTPVPSQAQPLGQRGSAPPLTPEQTVLARQLAVGQSKPGQVPFLAPRPEVPEGAQARTAVEPRRFEYPDQYDPELLQKRRWGAGAGMTKAQADLRWGPLEERPEFTTHQHFMEAAVKRAIAVATADPVGVDRWTMEHGQHRALIPIVQLYNAGFLRSMAQVDPQLAALIGNDPALSNDLRDTQVDPNTRNVQEMSQNQGLGLSPSQIISEARDRPPSEGGTLSRLMEEIPITGTWVGPMGDLNFKTMSAANEQHLAQLGPLTSLVDRMAVLARHLNTEEVKMYAGVKSTFERINQWMGTTFQEGWTKGSQEDRDRLITDNYDRYADEMAQQFDAEMIDRYGLRATDTIRALNRLRLSAAGLFAELGGERGRKTEDDVTRALQMSPGPGETKGMTEFQLDLLYEHLVGSYVMLMTSPAAVLHPKMMEAGKNIIGAGGSGAGRLGVLRLEELTPSGEAPSREPD